MRIVPGGLAAFNSLTYGALAPETVQFFQTQIANAPQMVGEYGNMFKQATQSIYQDFISAEALEKTRLALMYSNAMENRDVIQRLTLLAEFQSAQSEMQKWLMANPVVADLYNRQLCDGFSDTFKTTGKIEIGEKNYHYRRVMDGIVGEDDSHTIYLDDLREGDTELHLHEQTRILTSWEIGEILIKNGNDITNQSGGNL